MRKPTFRICKNKGTDQLRGDRKADQRLCFRCLNSTIPLLPKAENSSLLPSFCSCRAWFVSGLLGNPKRCFSRDTAHFVMHTLFKTFEIVRYSVASKMSRVMRKPKLCICENRDADQLRGSREADQRLCFRYLDSTIPPKSKISRL